MRLHAPLHFVVVEVLTLVNERLSVLVEGCIVQVLGLECGFVNHAVARVTFTDAMLFNELHGVSLISGNGSSCTRFPSLPLDELYEDQVNPLYIRWDGGSIPGADRYRLHPWRMQQ